MAKKFKKNHSWGVLGLILAIISLVLLYYRAYWGGILLAVFGIIFTHNQRLILHHKVHVWGTLLSILALILHLVMAGGLF